MRITIPVKLMISYLLLILLMGGTFYLYLSPTLDHYLMEETRENLSSELKLAVMMATAEMDNLQKDASAIAARIGAAARARVTIVAGDGTVVGDSELKQEQLKTIENHGTRPEIVGAITKGDGSSLRYSETLRTSMLYVASPFTDRKGDKGVVRLSLPLSNVEKAHGRVRTMLFAAIGCGFLLALLFSFILSRFATRTLRAVTSTARMIGDGDFTRRIPVRSNDELGDLVHVVNAMSFRISEQMQRLTAEKNKLDAILEGMGEGLLVTDRQGVVTLVNRAFVDLFSPGEEVRGKGLIQITRHPDLNETFRKVAEAGHTCIEECTIPRGKTLLTHWVPLLHDEALEGVVAVFHDISEIKRLENVRKDFVANVSHELRTPVTVIKGYAETLLGAQTGQSPELMRKFTDVIYRHAERLATLITDLLTLSELESGKLALDLRRENLAAILDAGMTLLRPKAEDKGVTLVLHPPPALPDVSADRRRLEQVVTNLLDNGVKYTPKGGSVSVSASLQGGQVEVAVRDTGMGIPPQALPRLFERFYRVDEARSRSEGGTGLGLSIVKHIVQLHGGTVHVISDPGKGSTFFFTVPVYSESPPSETVKEDPQILANNR